MATRRIGRAAGREGRTAENDIRNAFLFAAHDHLTVNHASARPTDEGEGNGYILRATGWHANGTPFALVSAPFEGDLIARAETIAQDLIRLHHGKTPMAGPAIRNSASRIRKALDRAAASVERLAGDAEALAGGVDGTVDQGRAILKDVADAARELREGLGIDDNGAPAGPLPGSADSAG